MPPAMRTALAASLVNAKHGWIVKSVQELPVGGGDDAGDPPPDDSKGAGGGTPGTVYEPERFRSYALRSDVLNVDMYIRTLVLAEPPPYQDNCPILWVIVHYKGIQLTTHDLAVRQAVNNLPLTVMSNLTAELTTSLQTRIS
jgi:hypothetical protein